MQEPKNTSTENVTKNWTNIQKVYSKQRPSKSYTNWNVGNMSSDAEWLRNLFNFLSWDYQNLPAAKRISPVCGYNMKTYLYNLKNGSAWATEVYDASGRYSTQFFFGNDFWLGSRTFCRELQRTDFNPSVPPFRLHFYVSKFVVKLKNVYKFSPMGRVVTVGLCLPEDCTVDDIKTMLMEDAVNKSSVDSVRSISILKVRAVPGSYSLFADKKLHLLFAILTVVVFITVIGTCYEISLERRQSRYMKQKQNYHQQKVICNNNDVDPKIFASACLQNVDKKISNGTYTSDVNSSPSLYTIPKDGKGSGGNSTTSQLIMSFSALSNSRKILNCGPPPEDAITCIHGLRFLSLSWVIMVHTYLQVFTVAENKVIRSLAEKNFMFQTVSNATFSVDSFFFISGLLVAYLYFKSARKEVSDIKRRSVRNESNCVMGVMKFFKLVGYRFIRLTPAYMFVLIIAEISMRWLHNISVFEPMSQNHISCHKYAWRNILYINSLFPMNDMCMLWSWYVSNDMQFYVLGIIILLLSVRHFRFAIGMLAVSMITSWCVTIFISIIYDYRARIEDPFANFDELYDKPWTRLGPYLVGMITGWFLFKTKCKLHISKPTALLGWFLSLGTLFSLVYGLHVFPLGLIGSSLYVSIGHTAWGIALAWIVTACCTGHGGFIDSFLSCPLLQPLSRLTYCAYLVHPIIMTVTNFQMGSPLHLQDAIIVILYLGNITASFIASFGISLLFEAPVVRLLKIIFSSPQPKKVTDRTNL